jgi:(p)ppGpp synthase/HD superfamily hydrolase
MCHERTLPLPFAPVPTSSLSAEVRRAEAIRFVIDAYDGVAIRPGKGLPHAQAVADVLRNAGIDERVQVAALLHDVVEDTPRTVDDVREAFGDDIAAIVDALTEDDEISHYAQRKRQLRSRIVAAGNAVLDISLADKIATLRHALVTGTELSRRKLTHYRATLQLGLAAGASEPLCTWLGDLLSAMAHRESSS